jgi:hypothetical protein
MWHPRNGYKGGHTWAKTKGWTITFNTCSYNKTTSTIRKRSNSIPRIPSIRDNHYEKSCLLKPLCFATKTPKQLIYNYIITRAWKYK